MKDTGLGKDQINKEEAAFGPGNTVEKNKAEIEETLQDDRDIVVKDRLDLTALIKQDEDKDCKVVPVTGDVIIKTGEEPNGLTVLEDESVLVCYGSGITRFDRTGQLLEYVKKGIEDFSFPTSILRLSDGKVVVVDDKGLHLLDRSLKFNKTLIKNPLNGDDFCRCAAEDDEGNIMTIKSNVSGEGQPTKAKIMIIDRDHGKVKKEIDLEEIIKSAMEQMDQLEDPEEPDSDPLSSHCTNLTYKEGKIYITGMN